MQILPHRLRLQEGSWLSFWASTGWRKEVLDMRWKRSHSHDMPYCRGVQAESGEVRFKDPREGREVIGNIA